MITNSAVGSYKKLDGQVVMWEANLSPLVEIGNNWSTNTLVGNCQPCTPISYVPESKDFFCLSKVIFIYDVQLS